MKSINRFPPLSGGFGVIKKAAGGSLRGRRPAFLFGWVEGLADAGKVVFLGHYVFPWFVIPRRFLVFGFGLFSFGVRFRAGGYRGS